MFHHKQTAAPLFAALAAFALTCAPSARAFGLEPTAAQGREPGAAAAADSAAGVHVVSAAPASVPTSAKRKAAAKKQVGALINAIRFDKRGLADKYLGFETMARRLLQTTFDEMTPAERTQFVTDFKALLVSTAFAKGHGLFAYLDGVLYGEARDEGAELHLASTIVVHRNVKKTEMPVEWVLAEEGGVLRVVDVVSMQQSTTAGIRDEEVLPLLHEGGKQKLLAVLHGKAQGAAKGK